MIPLWLGGKRIDNVYMLHQTFESLKDDEEKCKLCMELLRKVDEGIFIPWLEFDPETNESSKKKWYYSGPKEDTLDVFKKRLQRWESQSQSQQRYWTDEAINSISYICGIDCGIAKRACAEIKDNSNWLKKVEDQKWYKDNENKCQETLLHHPPEFIAWDSDSLVCALKRSSEQNGTQTLYLLNTGRAFIIKNEDVECLRYVILTGYGNPKLRINCPNGSKLNMKDNEITVKQCNLHDRDIFTEEEGRIINCN